MRPIAHRLSAFLITLLAAGTARGHRAHTAQQHSNDPLPLALLFSGLLVFGTGLYLSSRDDVDKLYAVAGLAVGLAGLAAALGLYLRQGF